MKFSLFMSSAAGRVLRVVGGAVLVAIAIWMQSVLGVILAIIGGAVLLAGVFDVCLIAPLMRLPFTGREIRAHADKPQV